MPAALRERIEGADVPPSAFLSKRRACNRLALEGSAFARQHALDAIDWRPWTAEILAEAQDLEMPILVLSGFASSDSSRQLGLGPVARRRFARNVNIHFLPVLVDRDERPDVDAYVMGATQVITGGGGWPAVVFLHPNGRPFDASSWGAAAGGDTGLPKLVRQVIRRIRIAGGSIAERAELNAEKMEARAGIDTSGPFPDAAAVAASMRATLAESFDAEAGSFGEPPLFPRAPLLEFLVHLHVRGGDDEALAMAVTSLEKLARSDLADAEHGGFRRYARQAGWKQPVPEKMLADNAALASAFFAAARASDAGERRSSLGEGGRRILDFLVKDLALGDGSFAVAVHAAGRDDTVLADANALAISALVLGAEVLGEPRYLSAARSAADAVDRLLRDGGRVSHCAWPGGRRCADGYLADQALLALAYLDLDRAVGKEEGRWLEAARVIADAMPERFEHQGTGGFFLSGADAAPLPIRYKPALDTAVPCGNSAAAALYVRLAARSGEARYSATARRVFEAFSEVLTLRSLALPAMAVALSAASEPPQLDPAPAVQP